MQDRTRPRPGAASNWLFPAGRVAFYFRTAGFLNIGSVAFLHRILHTTNLRLADAPGNIHLSAVESGLSKDSVLVVSQLNCIDCARLVERQGRLRHVELTEVEAGLRLVLAL